MPVPCPVPSSHSPPASPNVCMAKMHGKVVGGGRVGEVVGGGGGEGYMHAATGSPPCHVSSPVPSIMSMHKRPETVYGERGDIERER